MLARLIVETLLDGPQMMPPDLPPWVEDKEGYDKSLDTEDLAAEYIEGEVGRRDWIHNWPQHKSQHGNSLREKVMAWLKLYEIDHDPDALISAIDTRFDQLSQAKDSQKKWL